MITARTWLVPWASRGESAGTNGEDAESDQSRQNCYAVEGMQHQSKEQQQQKCRSQGNSSVWKEELAPQEGDADFGRVVQGVPLRKQQPARKKGRVSVWGGPHFVGSRGSAGNDWPCRAADRGQEKGESPRGRIQEGAHKTQAVA